MKKLLIAIVIIAVVGAGLYLFVDWKVIEEDVNDQISQNDNDIGNDNININQTALGALAELMNSEKYSYDLITKVEHEGETITETVSLAKDGENYAISMKGNEGEYRIIYKDGVTYMIIEAEKIVMEQTGGQDVVFGMLKEQDEMAEMLGKYSNIEKVGSGTGEIDGKTLPYEEYDSDGYKSKIYMENGQIYAMETENQIKIIKNASKSVPAGTFEIPTEGYTKIP